MWVSTVSAWLLSVPTLILLLFCIQDFDGIVNGELTNNWGVYLVQLLGENGAVAVLSILWVDSTCATGESALCVFISLVCSLRAQLHAL